MHGWDLDAYAGRAEAFGWHAIEIDGHDVDAIDRAYAEAVATTGRPTVIVARTEKGNGVAAVAEPEGMHGKPLRRPRRGDRRAGRRSATSGSTSPKPAERRASRTRSRPRPLELPALRARRQGGDAARPTARRSRRSARPAATSSPSTARSATRPTPRCSPRRIPSASSRCYIAEQQMVAAAVGLQVRGWKPFASTFAAFLTRAYDFIRMAAVSRAEHAPGRLPRRRRASARTARRRWAWRTWRCSARSTAAPCSTRATRTRRPRSSPQMADRDGRRLPAHHARKTAGHLRPGRGVPDRRQPGAALRRRGRGDARRRRRHRARGAERRRARWPPRASRPG